MNLVAVTAALVVVLGSAYINGALSYVWSFTDTSFGGFLGFVAPPLLTICAAVGGVVFGRVMEQ